MVDCYTTVIRRRFRVDMLYASCPQDRLTVQRVQSVPVFLSILCRNLLTLWILNIYSTNILTEYFKHAAHSPFFFLQYAVYFVMLSFLVPVIFTF